MDDSIMQSEAQSSGNTFLMPPSMLVSAAYNGKKQLVTLKFYEPESQKIILWDDRTGHKPYCYTKLPKEELGFLDGRADILDIRSTKRHDMMTDSDIMVSKIIADNPLAIGGTQSDQSVRNITTTWESDIKYYENYLYDMSLIVGRYYEIADGQIRRVDMDISEEVKLALKSLLWDRISSDNIVDAAEFQEYIAGWADLLNQPIPQIRRVAFDIEVEAETGRIPDPRDAEKTVTAVSFAGSDGLKQVFVLKRDGVDVGVSEMPDGVKVVFYEAHQEKKMIEDSFGVIASYPFVLTYNGDDFDMPYLYNRAKRLNVNDLANPLYMMRDSAALRHGVHIDLYRALSNRSLQIYAFSNKYKNYSLNSVSEALLGEGKIDYGVSLGELSLYQTARYCFHDALLTYRLTSFNSDILMNLLVVIARIAKMPVDDIARVGVSQWIRSLLYYEHRQRNALIPTRDELKTRTAGVQNTSVIKDKKYRGGLVVEPKEGIHFDVTVMDFASLYPSIIKVKNLSYETVRCPHRECEHNKIPDTNHWVCTKKNGMESLIIGSLRDLRVNYYKSLSRSGNLTAEQREQYVVVSQALKVILNASYGVMGSEIFPLYFLPAAEATTATGRYIIMQTIKKCEAAGIEVLYGDTDSLFTKNPTSRQIQNVIDGAKKDHGVELEVDKEYRYVVLSNRKKNYLGVTKNGDVHIKGLTGKKSHTPPFIRTLFYELLDVLSEVENVDGFERSKIKISKKIAHWATRLQERDIPLEELAFNVMLSKPPSEYTKATPQHIKAARLLEGRKEIKKGDIISYVKVLGKLGVKPVELARVDEIDAKKYLEFLESTMDQITSSMGLDFDSIVGKPKQTGLEDFFWG